MLLSMQGILHRGQGDNDMKCLTKHFLASEKPRDRIKNHKDLVSVLLHQVIKEHMEQQMQRDV